MMTGQNDSFVMTGHKNLYVMTGHNYPFVINGHNNHFMTGHNDFKTYKAQVGLQVPQKSS